MIQKTIFVFSLLVVVVAGCRGNNRRFDTMPTIRRSTGECADTLYDGVWGESGEREINRADRDLNSDGANEFIVADQRRCLRDNCYWNVFVGPKDCRRYVGTIAAKTIRLGDAKGPGQFREIAAHWATQTERRFFMHRYIFENGAYHMEEALLCKYIEGDVVECARESPKDFR